MKMKKIITAVTVVTTMALIATGCGSKSAEKKGFDPSNDIMVVSREDGSGTRGAFIELFGIEEKDKSGNKIDNTTDEANITNNTSVMLTSVSGNDYAIGYVSLGSLNDTVKAVEIDGAKATAEDVKNGTYKVSRPFNIATKGEVSEATQDFIDYIMSIQGQEVVTKSGYIANDGAKEYAGTKPAGKIVVAGSSSVTPVMEKLKEAYLAVNTNAEIEVQQSDSTTGMTSVADGICDIGMASRALKDTEVSSGIKATVIATDGIAVVVNKNNTLDGLSSEQVKEIFTGEVLSWDEVTE